MNTAIDSPILSDRNLTVRLELSRSFTMVNMLATRLRMMRPSKTTMMIFTMKVTIANLKRLVSLLQAAKLSTC